MLLQQFRDKMKIMQGKMGHFTRPNQEMYKILILLTECCHCAVLHV
jgi:hypothetical protein